MSGRFGGARGGWGGYLAAFAGVGLFAAGQRYCAAVPIEITPTGPPVEVSPPLIVVVSAPSIAVLEGGTIPINEAFLSPTSNPFHYSTYATYSYGNSAVQTGTALNNSQVNAGFTFDPSLITPLNSYIGDSTVTLTVTDQDTMAYSSVSFSLEVDAHASPQLSINNTIFPLTMPVSASVAVPTHIQGIDSSGIHAVTTLSPVILNVPHAGVSTANLDLDTITKSGAPQISITLAPFSNLVASDSESQGEPFDISVVAPPGVYSTTFMLNYSDFSDESGAYVTGSQQTSFTVTADVSDTNVEVAIVTAPEPTTFCIAALGAMGLLLRRRVKRGR